MFSIKQKIAAGFGLAFLIIGFVGFRSYESAITLVKLNASMDQIQSIAAEAEAILLRMDDAESGERGYIITGSEEFLKPYLSALPNLEIHRNALKNLIATNPLLKTKTASLEENVEKKLAIVKTNIALRKAGQLDETVAMIRSGQGKKVMDEIRNIVSEIESDVVKEFNIRNAELEAETQDTMHTFGILMAIVIILFGGVYYLIHIFMDDRESAEAAVRDREERYRILSRLTSDFLYKDRITDDGTSEFEWADRDTFHKVVGYTMEEYNSLGGWKKLFHPEDLAEAESNHRALLDGHPTLCFSRVRQPDGSYRWIKFHHHPIVDAQGRVSGVLGAMEDVTDRKRIEIALQESEKRYRELVNQGLGFICTHDLDGVISSINPSAAQALGYRVDEIIGKNLYEFLHPSVQKSMNKYLELIRKNLTVNGVMIMRTKSGEEQIWNYHNVLQFDENEKPSVLGHAHNITERVRAEKEREKLISELQEALSKVKTLSGMLPICASCKKVRDDQGYWHQIENYISEHSEADFTHGICQECSKKLYPDIQEEGKLNHRS